MLIELFGGIKVKVLQINSVCGIGSTGRIATDIHANLIQQGHESYIAYGRGTPLNCDMAIRIGNNLDNYMHVAKTRIFDRHGLGSKRATRDFIDRIRGLDPDVIHLHNIHGYYINIELLFDYLKGANKPVIWTLHDCWAFTGHCTNPEYARCNCWKIDSNHKCIQKRSYPSSLLINNSSGNFNMKRKSFTGVKNLTIITPSNWLAGLVKKSFLNEYPLMVINNGINLDVFKYTEGTFREKYRLENKFIILGVANIWSEKKGYDSFINLSQEINKDEIIVLVGLNKKQLKSLPSNIIGINRTNSVNELVDIYSAADVFVNPTLEDNFPTTNLEALACGTPVITFDTGGSSESIDNGCGEIVEHGDFDTLLNKIWEVKRIGKSKYKRLAINRAEKLYKNIDRFNEYIQMYKKVATN